VTTQPSTPAVLRHIAEALASCAPPASPAGAEAGPGPVTVSIVIADPAIRVSVTFHTPPQRHEAPGSEPAPHLDEETR
jgi:hypothetical protein